MNTTLTVIEYESDLIADKLAPLKEGKPVLFQVEDSKCKYKRRAGDRPIMMLTPTSVYGDRTTGKLVISLQGYGCEIVDPATVKPIELRGIGVSWSTSKILCQELNRIFKEVRNAKDTE